MPPSFHLYLPQMRLPVDAVVDRARAAEAAGFEGTPTRPIPVTIGGVGRRTLALVRAHADWWNVALHQLDRVDAMRDQAGDARLSVQTMVALAPDAAARDEVEAAARLTGSRATRVGRAWRPFDEGGRGARR